MLHNRNARCGDFLFPWRSFLPVLSVPFFVLSFNEIHYLRDSHSAQHLWAAFCLFLSIGGLFVRGLTIGFVSDGTSGRNTKQQRATELNTTGMYSICRNPLYFGNLLIWVGILSYTRMVLRREYTTVFAIGVVFFAMDTVSHYLIENAFYMDASWAATAHH